MGKVYLVGAGPGDPELITVKGVRCIREADIILYDRLIHPKLLDYARSEAELLYCGKLPGFHTMKQETMNRFLVKHALAGKTVTRLKGGDPFVYGRGGEEAEALVRHGVDFEVVPGITAGIAAPAYAGIPVTHRAHASTFAFVTGHRKKGEEEELQWENLARGIDTLAIYMGVKNLPYIRERLLTHGKPPHTPVALIHWGTTHDQRTVTGTLEDLVDLARRHQVKNPTLILVGEVVAFREKLAWFEKRLDGEWEGARLEKVGV
ncbi:uroporphyrinogen-III C-methyltransferase [Melghirimyces profundicolus]|uniref:Uroporphyrinogen-III C-methyltransferase n=1 Tax=Melghirimyces profundicolus TaxID=1242148 RepID=A0A2T6C4J1_9BACL|nr:uroporphyrinogen-III C-methyltransferase [Melghirimyces profundicolus]PTX63240.1 uroporphyrinogen-III C-methyltransferase [Melghirimyces profundicolus]